MRRTAPIRGNPLSRAEEARLVIESCRTEDGFLASGHLYPELWLRDLVFSEWALLRLGQADTVKRHLRAFMKAQRSSGQVPSVINHGLRRLFNPWFHGWTSDSEPLLVLGLSEYVKSTADEGFRDESQDCIHRSLEYARSKLNGDGLLPGMDWRDALMNYQGKALLSNQLLLMEAFRRADMGKEAARLEGAIRDSFRTADQGFFADSVWRKGGKLRRDFRVDSLGVSLSVILGLDQDSLQPTLDALQRSMTPEGCRNLVPPHGPARHLAFASAKGASAFLRNGAAFRNRALNYQNSTYWPFVEIRVVRALALSGRLDAAKRLAETILERQGLAEWYRPLDGKPKGSRDQLWTAAAVVEALDFAQGNLAEATARFP